jgi:hypothetical protein
MTLPPEFIPARVGELVAITVPNWAVAGFRWNAHFDGSALVAVSQSTTSGATLSSRAETLFQFKLLKAQASLRLVLNRPGQPPRQTRDYLIGRD